MNKINISPIGKIVNGNEVKVILDPKYAKALKGLEGYSHVQILWWMNGSDNQRDRNVLVEKKPYKNGPDEIGVFALRSPERPNPIAVSNVNIAYVDEESGTVGLSITNLFKIIDYFKVDANTILNVAESKKETSIDSRLELMDCSKRAYFQKIFNEMLDSAEMLVS